MFYIATVGNANAEPQLADEAQTRELANKAAEKLALDTDDRVLVLEVVGAYRRKYTVAQEGPGSSVPLPAPGSRLDRVV